MAELTIRNMSVSEGQASLVKDASFSTRSGEFVALLGPNGSGKTSLLRAAIGLARPSEGSARLNGEDVQALEGAVRARTISYLPQQRPLAWPARVQDVIALGRFSHGAAAGRLGDQDRVAVENAIKACDLGHLAKRSANTLSGGEEARMHLARAFAAEAPLLVADEPTAALDPRHQFRMLDLIASYVAKGGGALVVLHDVQLAARYASRLIWMKDGQLIADGPPSETLSAERLHSVYGVHARIEGDLVVMESATQTSRRSSSARR